MIVYELFKESIALQASTALFIWLLGFFVGLTVKKQISVQMLISSVVFSGGLIYFSIALATGANVPIIFQLAWFGAFGHLTGINESSLLRNYFGKGKNETEKK